MRVNRKNIAEHLFEYQLSLIDKTVKDALKTPDWRETWILNTEQYEKLKMYSILLIKKVFKCNKSKAEKTFDWFLINFGIKNISYDTKEENKT